jgi:hypothetical protein
MLEQTNGGDLCGVNAKTKRNSNLVIMFCDFPREKLHTWVSLRKDGLVHSRYSIAYLTTQFLLFLLTLLN